MMKYMLEIGNTVLELGSTRFRNANLAISNGQDDNAKIQTTMIVESLNENQIDMLVWEGLRRSANKYLRHISGNGDDKKRLVTTEQMEQWKQVLETGTFEFVASEHVGIKYTSTDRKPTLGQKIQIIRDFLQNQVDEGNMTEEQMTNQMETVVEVANDTEL